MNEMPGSDSQPIPDLASHARPEMAKPKAYDKCPPATAPFPVQWLTHSAHLNSPEWLQQTEWLQQPEGERYRQALTQLAAINRQLSSILEKERILEIVCAAARELLGAGGACFVLRDQEMVHYCQENALAPLWKGQRFPIGNCISGWAILHRMPVVIEDIYQDERVPHDYYRSTFIKSLVMMPIRLEDPLGSIGVYWDYHYRATERDLELLQVLADSTAIALVNAEHYEAMKQARDEAKHHAEQLARSHRAKDEFLATISHELRSPLNVILGYAELVYDPKTVQPLSESERLDLAQQAGDVLLRQARMQKALIGDLLDLAELLAGRLAFERDPTDLVVLVSRSLETVEARAQEKGLTLEIKLPSLPLTASVDPIRFTQILGKLTDNALQFTPPGGHILVCLDEVSESEVSESEVSESEVGEDEVTEEDKPGPESASQAGKPADFRSKTHLKATAQLKSNVQFKTKARLTVTDTGCGITGDFLPHVFETFRQKDSSNTRSHQGMGIGLALVKGLVELHGGHVTVDSAGIGQGTTFQFTLPL